MSNPAVLSDIDRIVMLMEEIAIAQSKLQPTDTGHIHTAINYMRNRVEEIKKDIAYGEIQ
tara:strand:- start:1964 stop:2143 length:180 start_codon:yes stop_codon:yes gene_type:complete